MRDGAIYKGMTHAELERQYSLRATRPGYEETDIPRWMALSEAYRAEADCELDIRYGDLPRNRLDLFRAKNARGLIVYIHGGYWQRGDKSVYSFIAAPFVAQGFDVALLNYQMCPDVSMPEIAPQIRKALLFLDDTQDKFGISTTNLNVMGHSAGGHLTMEMVTTDWSSLAKDVNFIHAGVAVSGIYDFTPILYCSENEGLRMRAQDALEVSTIQRADRIGSNVLLAYGENEPADMHRQSIEMHHECQSDGHICQILRLDTSDHFETLDDIADSGHVLFKKTMSLFGT